MPERKIMSRSETFEFIAHVGNAVIGGEAPPPTRRGEVMRTEDMGDAMDAFMHSLAERFDKIPGEVSEDLAVQEVIRHRLDGIMADAALSVRATVTGIEGGGT